MTTSGALLLRFAAGTVGLATILAVVGRCSKPLVIDKPSPADVILVVSGDYEGRMPRAIELYEQGYGRRIIVDEDASRDYYGQTLADRRRAELARRASPAAEVCPILGATTSAESRDVATCLQTLHVKSALIVTSDFHTRRALSIMQFRMPSIQWSVAASKSTFDLKRWWESRTAVATVVEEWTSLIYWKIVEQRRERKGKNS